MIALLVALGLHQRGIAATRTEQVLDCHYAGSGAHMHDTSCYDAAGNLVCPLTERELHQHDDSCYTETRQLACGLDEHAHSDACYDEEGNLICGLEEHVHTDACYQVTRELSCGKEEVTENHTHGPGCFREVTVDDEEGEAGTVAATEQDDAAAETNETSDELADLPAQDFSHQFTDADGNLVLRVDVAAPEGALPEGTTMQAAWIDPVTMSKKQQAAVETALAKKADGKVIDQQAVDITFLDAQGNKVEPAKKVVVTFTSGLVVTDDQVTVVHLDDLTNKQLKAQQKALEAGKTAEQAEPKRTAQVVDELSDEALRQQDVSLSDDQLAVESDQFSTYVLSVTSVARTLEASDGGTYSVTLDAPAAAGVPAGAELRVSEVYAESDAHDAYEEGAAEALGVDGGEVTLSRFFDIKIVGSDVREVQPAVPVQVRIELADAPEDAGAGVVHFNDETGKPEVVEAQPEGEGATAFDAEGFSVYGVVYTVDFHWDVDGKEYEYSLTGGGVVGLRELLPALGVVGEGEVEAFLARVRSAEFSDASLAQVAYVAEDTTAGDLAAYLGVEPQYSAGLTADEVAGMRAKRLAAGDWALVSLLPFASEEALTVTMSDGDQFVVRVTDAQMSAHVITASGEHFRITVTYDEEAKIPEGSVLVAKEIPEGSNKYEKYLEETSEKWEESDRGYISLARFFDIEILKDGKNIEPKAPVEVKIVHDGGLALDEDESLSVIHFAEDGTEIIDEIHSNDDSTQIVYEQESFSVIGTVSTVKDSGWPTSNGRYVLVLQDGDDYYALKQDGSLAKVRYFNNTVSFIGEGTTTTDYIEDYLWYVVSSGTRGKISDEYTEYNATPAGQTFIDPNSSDILSASSRQLQIRDGKIYCNGQLPGSSSYTQVTLSASGGQLGRVALTSDSASPALFASASSFTANDNETDLFTQEEVESIVDKWKEQKTQETSADKTAEVYDYENRVYQVDITASSSDYEVAPSIALEFVVDASRSMFFPTSLTQVGTFNGTNASNVRDWINSHGDTSQIYFVIQNKNGAATQYAIFYDPNSSYQYWNGRWNETRYGQWLWCDASVYNPPDDVSNGGTHNSMQSGLPLSDWTFGNMDDGKIYTTGITGTSDGTYGTRKTWVSRIEYLKQCARVASQVIYAVDENAQIGLIGFNANVTDYGTFGKSQQQNLLNSIDNISLDGGTNHQAGLQKAIDKYEDQNFYAQHYAGRKHVVVLVTDGAPNQSGVNWTTIGNVATNLKNLTDDFGHKTELYTMGLSLSNVGSNQTNLFNISSGTGYTYAAEDAAQIINAVTKIVDSIFVQANLVADVTDVIDPAFYPVNKATGLPLAENDWIKLDGSKASPGASDAVGQVKKDSSTGNWYVEWKNQNIDWPTTDSNGAVTEPGWHGTVFVKAKEDFLGGNGISTNAEGSQLEAKKYIVRGETTPHDMPAGDHTEELETPYVNVDELDITKNDTEWTVYLGTEVNPLAEVKALWEKVKVREVVTKTDSDHRVSSDDQLTYQYASNVNDNRPEANGREEFPLSDLGITLTDADWNELIAGNPKTITYSAYDHSQVGTITIKLTQNVKENEKDLSESPHDTTVTGDEVEKYTLTVSYRPSGANISDWHTGSYGSSMSGSRAGNISKDNTHIINVYVKGLQITKVDLDDRMLPGAKFALYRTARDGETDLLEINGGQYFKIADLDTSSTGIATKEQIEQLEEGEQYYLVETQAPEGYIAVSPIPVNLVLTDTYTPKPGTTTQAAKPETGIYDWTQNASIVLDAESGVKQTNADNTVDLTHTVNTSTNYEIIYYRITNNPGVALPAAGGIGTTMLYLLGIGLIGLAGTGLVMKRRGTAA